MEGWSLVDVTIKDVVSSKSVSTLGCDLSSQLLSDHKQVRLLGILKYKLHTSTRDAPAHSAKRSGAC